MGCETEAYNNNNNGDFEQQMMVVMTTWQQQQQQLGFGFRDDVAGCCHSSMSGGADVAETMGGLSGSVASLLHKHSLEFDWAFQIQNERLRRTLQESSTQHLSMLLQKYQPYITALLSEKDQMISTANKNKLILEDYLKNMELEIATWQTKARESEATVADLNNALSQIRERIDGGDEESCCDYNPESGDRCRICRARRSCVVFFPCRHICSCEFCEGFVDICPVCKTVKESTVEALLD